MTDRILKYIESRRKRTEVVAKKFYPDHKFHSFNEEPIDVEFFDAMFVKLNVKCSCGEVLSLTREMFE